MKKGLFVTLSILSGIIMFSTSFAKQISESDAQNVATNFYASKRVWGQTVDMKLKHISSFTGENQVVYNTYYVFENVADKGFVVVAGDDVAIPILAYSTDNSFNNGSEWSPQVSYWMGIYHNQIAYIIKNHVVGNEDINSQWAKWQSSNVDALRPTNVIIEPLLTTTWNQGNFYDLYTPGSGSTKTPVGCVATAMAQIMKFWNYPSVGTGSYSYNAGGYGAVSADFGATSYNWSLMGNSLSSLSLPASKEAISLIGYHCAIAVRMSFSPSGSGSQVLAYSNNARCAENAFKNHFGYKNTIRGYERDNFTATQWITMLKDELDAGRPLLYAGYGNSGGHAFVFDGYDDSDFFHVNWGWGGMSDGYFVVDNLSPGSLGIGGGSGGFNGGQQVLVNIEPNGVPETLKVLKISANSELAISNDTIAVGEAFSINLQAGNFSEIDYVGGTFRAEVFASDSSYITFFNRQQNLDVYIDSSLHLTFANAGFSSLVTGSYFVKVSYLDINGKWAYIDDYNGYVNKVAFVVKANEPTNVHSLSSIENSIKIYPNPANNIIKVDINDIIKSQIHKLTLYNIQGQIVKSVLEPANSNNSYLINVAEITSGIYYLNIATELGILHKKIIIRH